MKSAVNLTLFYLVKALFSKTKAEKAEKIFLFLTRSRECFVQFLLVFKDLYYLQCLTKMRSMT